MAGQEAIRWPKGAEVTRWFEVIIEVVIGWLEVIIQWLEVVIEVVIEWLEWLEVIDKRKAKLWSRHFIRY